MQHTPQPLCTESSWSAWSTQHAMKKKEKAFIKHRCSRGAEGSCRRRSCCLLRNGPGQCPRTETPRVTVYLSAGTRQPPHARTLGGGAGRGRKAGRKKPQTQQSSPSHAHSITGSHQRCCPRATGPVGRLGRSFFLKGKGVQVPAQRTGHTWWQQGLRNTLPFCSPSSSVCQSTVLLLKA